MKIFSEISFVIVMCLMLSLSVTGCTDQKRAKSFGGSVTKVLPKGEKLVNVTWKDSNIWFLTRQMKPGEKAEVYKFKEESSFGMMEGVITVQEQE